MIYNFIKVMIISYEYHLEFDFYIYSFEIEKYKL